MNPSEIINPGSGSEIHFCLDTPETNAQFTLFKVVIHPEGAGPTLS